MPDGECTRVVMFDRPSVDTISTEKMVSQKAASGVRVSIWYAEGLTDIPSAYRGGRFREACWLVGRVIRRLQAELWGINLSQPVDTFSGRGHHQEEQGEDMGRNTISYISQDDCGRGSRGTRHAGRYPRVTRDR